MRHLPRIAGVLGWLLTAAAPLRAGAPPGKPLALHPDNPNYFLFRGKPAVLITSGEHYGALLNREFDYLPYLDELQAHGFNQTRAFSGTYREVPGSFNIAENTLAPAPVSFVCPWPRTTIAGARDGGGRFDLEKWNPEYFARLKDFVTQAGRRGIVVELVLFCTLYDDALWDVNPMNPANNVNRTGPVGRLDVYSLKNAALTAAQEALVGKIVTELREFDNVYYELCNEPYERAGLTREWNDRMIAAILAAERDLPARHLIAQGMAWRAGPIAEPDPRVSVFNLHAAAPESVTRNYSLDRLIADDETGGKGNADFPYRSEAWEFMLAGGGAFSHLDFSFTCSQPRGTADFRGAPGGGGPTIRRQLQVLKNFLEGFDFIRMKPDSAVLQPAAGVTARALVEPGRAYAIYVKGGAQVRLALDLPAGAYRAEWVDTRTGKVEKAEAIDHAGGDRTLASPVYAEDIALRVQRREADPDRAMFTDQGAGPGSRIRGPGGSRQSRTVRSPLPERAN